MRQFSQIVARNSAIGLVAQFAIKLISFGFSVMVVRRLGVQEFGQYAAVLAFGSIFTFLSDLGLSPYAVREVARHRDLQDGSERANSIYGNLLVLRFVLSILAVALVLLTAWLTGRPPLMIGALALAGLGLVMYSAEGAAEAMITAFERLDLIATAKVCYQLIFVALGSLVLFNGLGYYGLIVANLLGIMCLTIMCLRSARRLGIDPGRVVVGSWPRLLRASMPFGIIGFTLGLSYKFDSVLLNIFRSDVETGYYNAAYNLVFSTIVLSNVINTALYPSLARHAATNPADLPAVHERALRYLLAIAIPIAVGTWALADKIVPLLFRLEYTPAVPALQIVIWVVPLMFATEFLGYVIVISGRERLVARAVIVGTAFNVALNMVIVPRFGYIGAAYMTVLTEVVLVGQYVWALREQLSRLNWDIILLRPLLAAVLMGVVVIGLRDLPVLLNVALSGLCYFILLLLLRVVGRDELRFVRGLRQRAEGVIVP